MSDERATAKPKYLRRRAGQDCCGSTWECAADVFLRQYCILELMGTPRRCHSGRRHACSSSRTPWPMKRASGVCSALERHQEPVACCLACGTFADSFRPQVDPEELLWSHEILTAPSLTERPDCRYRTADLRPDLGRKRDGEPPDEPFFWSRA